MTPSIIALAVAAVVLAFAVIFHAVVSTRDLHAMSALDDTIAAQTAAVTANTASVNSLIAAKNANEPTPDQLAAIAANTAQITANNTAADNAVSPPAA